VDTIIFTLALSLPGSHCNCLELWEGSSMSRESRIKTRGRSVLGRNRLSANSSVSVLRSWIMEKWKEWKNWSVIEIYNYHKTYITIGK